MNNKGFAITTILYGVLILFCLLLLSMLGILSSYRGNLEKLMDKNNGARAIVQSDSINKNTFVPVVGTSGEGKYVGNGIYSFSKANKWDAYCLQPGLFVNGNKYILSYSIQKTGGKLESIGGHSLASKEVSFYINNTLQEAVEPVEGNTYHTVGYNPLTNLNDSTETYEVRVEFLYDNTGVTGSNPGAICVEPNRALNTAVSVNISNLSLRKIG